NVVNATHNAPTNSLTLEPPNFPIWGIYDVTVQAFASDANDDVSGPVSAAAPAVTQYPPNVKVEYDGRTARVTWEPITSPVIIGYLTTLLGVPDTKVTTIGPAASINVAYAPTTNYGIVVQALTNAGLGMGARMER